MLKSNIQAVISPSVELVSAKQSDPTAFFQTVSAAFSQAFSQGRSQGRSQACSQARNQSDPPVENPSERFFMIGGFPICLRFASSTMLDHLTPALAHLAIPHTRPALTVGLWDTLSTGIEMPKPPWGIEDYLTRSEIRGYTNERICTAYDVWSGGLQLLDKQKNTAFFWTRNVQTLPIYERGAPLRMILHWWMHERGRQLIHAGAVGLPTGGVLLAGKGGSGKSTTSLACLDSALLYASDDYCLVSTESEESTKLPPYVHSLYNTAKLEATHVNRNVPQLKPMINNQEALETEKALFFLHQHYPEKLTSGFPIRAILLPQVTGEKDTKLSSVSSMSALRALAPSTMLQLSGTGKSEFQSMANLVKQVPSYCLELGTELSQIPQVILKFLKEGYL